MVAKGPSVLFRLGWLSFPDQLSFPTVETYNFKTGFGDDLPGALIANIFIPTSAINEKQNFHLEKILVLENNALIFLILVPDNLLF
jgi:hypothetical protein